MDTSNPDFTSLVSEISELKIKENDLDIQFKKLKDDIQYWNIELASRDDVFDYFSRFQSRFGHSDISLELSMLEQKKDEIFKELIHLNHKLHSLQDKLTELLFEEHFLWMITVDWDNTSLERDAAEKRISLRSPAICTYEQIDEFINHISDFNIDTRNMNIIFRVQHNGQVLYEISNLEFDEDEPNCL